MKKLTTEEALCIINSGWDTEIEKELFNNQVIIPFMKKIQIVDYTEVIRDGLLKIIIILRI